MAVRRLEIGSPTTVGTVGSSHKMEPTPITDHGRNRKYSDSVDSDVDENTKDKITSMDRFPRYVDCQETLIEMSFIKWISGFRLECRRMSCIKNKEVFYGLLNFFYENIEPEIVDCRNKTNKSTLVKFYLEQALMFFRKFYKRLQTPMEAVYYNKMSSLLAYFIDLKLMASKRYDDKSWHRKTSSNINTVLSIFLEDNIDYMFDSIFQLHYIFYGSVNIYIGSIMLPVYKKLLAERPIPKHMSFLTYLRYILCFKLWRKTVCSAPLVDFNKRKELEQIRLLLRKLNPPRDFMSQYEKYNWPKWPKLTISLNGTPDKIEKDLKNVTFVLYNAKLLLKDCTKDILDASRKDVPRLMKLIEEQCSILRPDLFSHEGEQVLDTWSSNFDNCLKPLIPTTRSCNSLVRKIKYNLYDDITIKHEHHNINENPNISNTKLLENNLDTQVLTKTEENSENHVHQVKENISICGDENKQNENTKVLKTIRNKNESFPIIVKQQSNENEIQIKKLKSDTTQCTNDNLHTFNTPSSNNINKLDFNTENNSHTTGYTYSTIKGLKRILPFSESGETSKKPCITKAQHEKYLINSSSNKIINSDFSNHKHENITCTILNKDNSLLQHSTNIQNINGVTRLKNESSVKENEQGINKLNPESSIATALNLKCTQNNNFSDTNSIDNKRNCNSETIELNSDQNDVASPSSDIQYLKLPCNSDSPESKTIINNSEKIEMETNYSDTKDNNSSKVEHVLSSRNSEKVILKLVSSRRSHNENENTRIYALPMDQKLTHVEHPYVENTINSNTRDLEVVNVLSPVSINSSDIPINKSAWVSDMTLVHVHNDHNDIDVDHHQSSKPQLNGLSNSVNLNISHMSNHSSEVEHTNVQLETPIVSRSYNRMEPRMYTDDQYKTVLSPSESSVSNSAYNTTYDVNRTPIGVTVKTIPVTLSSKNVINELNSPNKCIYRGSTNNLSFNGLKKNSALESQSSYNFAIRPTDMSTVERVSPSNKEKSDIDVVSDEFSDVDSIDLRINSTEPKKNNSRNNFSMSSLISTDLKSVNALNNFEKSGNWSTIKNPSDLSNLHQKQKLKIYTDPTELILGPVNLNTQSGLPVNLNETLVKKVFLGNKSPSQVYYSPMVDFCISSDIDMTNHRIIEDPKQNNFKSISNIRDSINKCSNDNYIHSVLQPVNNDPSIKPTLISHYDGVLNQNPSVVNNGLIYNYSRSDNNSSLRYESSLQLQHKTPNCLSPHNGLTFTNYESVLGSNLLEDPNKKEEQNLINMAHLMHQSSKNCKVHYKWPLNKNKNLTNTTNGKVQETSQNLDYKRNSNVLYKYTDDELNQTRLQNVSPNEIQNKTSSLLFNERKNDTSYQSNQQYQDIVNLISSNLLPVIESDVESNDEENQFPSRPTSNFDGSLMNELAYHQDTMFRNTKMSNQNLEAYVTLSREVFDASRYLFCNGRLFFCMNPKCANQYHFRVIPSNADMLRHEFTVPFDDFRFNIQYKYKQLLTSSLKTWPNIPVLVQLAKRCLCENCGDFNAKLNQNQDMLHSYVEGRRSPKIDGGNNENEEPTNPQITLSWKKNLAYRFSSEAIAKQTLTQMIDNMQKHINRFKRAFTIFFTLSDDAQLNSKNLQNVCENFPVINKDKMKSFKPKHLENIEIANKCFIDDLLQHSYQYSQVPKVIPKYVIEKLSNSLYPLHKQKILNTSYLFDEEHLPYEVNRYYVENSPSPAQSINPNLTSQSLKYVHENIPNTSHQSIVENSPSTSRQSSVRNLTNSPHQLILNNFSTSSHGISLDPCPLNDRVHKHGHLSCYFTDGQIYTEFPHPYLQVPSVQFPSSSTNSYYGSPVNMPSDNSVPFRSPSLSANSVPNSPSSDCSIPSLVETVATAVPEHALLDDSLEAVNAAHNLMLISNRHRYNSTTSIVTTNTTNTTDSITVTTTTTTNNIANTNISKTDPKSNNSSLIDTTVTNISSSDNTNHKISTTDTSETLQLSTIDPEPEENQKTEIVHNSRRKKKKKHDKKKDKKKKGKR